MESRFTEHRELHKQTVKFDEFECHALAEAFAGNPGVQEAVRAFKSEEALRRLKEEVRETTELALIPSGADITVLDIACRHEYARLNALGTDALPCGHLPEDHHRALQSVLEKIGSVVQ